MSWPPSPRRACWSLSWPCSTRRAVRRDPQRDKTSHLATVTTTGLDGRRGLLAFTCLDSMRRWNPRARPVPVPTQVAAGRPGRWCRRGGRRPRRTGRVRHRGRRPANARIRPQPPGGPRQCALARPEVVSFRTDQLAVLSDSGATMARRKWRLSHPHRPSRPSGPGRGSPLTGAVSTGSPWRHGLEPAPVAR